VAPHHVRREVGAPQGVRLRRRPGVAAVQHLERAQRRRPAVRDLVHRAAVPASEDGKPFELRETELAADVEATDVLGYCRKPHEGRSSDLCKFGSRRSLTVRAICTTNINH
jgi:hypothetical protein